MRITIIGLGYVGAVTAVCLAKEGNIVYGIDTDAMKVAFLSEGKTPIVEEKIENITRDAARSGNLIVSTELGLDAIDVDIIFICVGTPSASNGSQDLSAIKRVSDQLGSLLRDVQSHPAIVVRSTVPAGTTESIIQPILEQSSGKRAGEDFGLGFQPEFLREGSSVQDFYNPPFTIVGGDEVTIRKTRSLFESFPGEFKATDVKSAEMLKVACNAFHALKVTFANEIGRISQAVGLDSRTVMDLLCMDTQLNISKTYLRPGFAFGGSCLPKDLRALLYVAKQNDVDLPMLSGVMTSNRVHVDHAAELIVSQNKRKVGFIGLSFKQGTDDLRESPLVALAEFLIGKGFQLKIYDEAVNVAFLRGSNRDFIQTVIPHFEHLVTDDLDSVLEQSELVVVGHKSTSIIEKIKHHGSRLHRVVDLVGLEMANADVECQGICW